MTALLVVACVAPADLMPEVDELTGEVKADPRRADLTASDAAAVEHALRVSEAWGGRVLVVAAGPPSVDPVLVDLAALDCEVIRVGHRSQGDETSAAAGPIARSSAELAGDAESVAGRLARAIRAEGDPGLVVCGDRSAEHGVGAVPAYLADALGFDQALGLVSLSVAGPGRLAAERRLDGGWRERLDITGPAVISVEAAGVRLRRAGLAAALATGPGCVRVAEEGAGPVRPNRFSYSPPTPYRPRTRPIPAPEGDPRQRLVTLTGALSNREPPRIIGPLEPAEAADEVLDFLRKSGVEAPQGSSGLA